MFPTDADALFAAVLARPADDLPRLVYADAIEETGHPAAAARATYIRTAVELAQCDDTAERARLERLIAAARPGFADEVDVALGAAGLTQLQVVRSRGFAESLYGPEASLPVAARLLGHLAPWRVTWLSASDDMPPIDWLDDLPRFARLEELVFTWTLPPYALPTQPMLWRGRVERLLSHRALEAMPDLARLGFVRMNLTDGWLVAFLGHFTRSAWTPRIVSLDLRHNHLTDRAANFLIAARDLPADFALELRGNRFTPAGQELLRRRFGGRVRF